MHTNYMLKNATIIDVEKGTTYQGSIEIDQGSIANIFLPGDALPLEQEVIDMEGKYILPGLIDMHCHIKEGFAPQFVASGVTTVRNTAGNVLELKRLIEAQADTPTPRVFSADRMIDGPPGLWGPSGYANFVTDNPNEARKEVKRQAAAGAKFIKAYGWLTKSVLEAVVLEAKDNGLEVSCDLIHASQVNALDAARIGVTWFEHASGFVQSLYPNWHTRAEQTEWDKINWTKPDKASIKALCKQMLQYDVKLCPTLIINDQINKVPDYWHPYNEVTKTMEGLKQHWEVMTQQHAAALKKQLGLQNQFTKVVAKTYFDLGGTVVAGTDTPAGVWTFPGMGLHRELELFVEIGFTNMEALQAATINAAKSIQLEEIGAIKKGNIADLVILNKNPLTNIKHTKEIDTIVKGGRRYTEQEVLEHIPSEAFLKKHFETFSAAFKEEIRSKNNGARAGIYR